MSLGPGTRLGPYEVLSAIGAGGMGEVYRARDTKLNRDVALKVLPDAFASGPERLARLHREAQVLASLNHTHIAPIYGLEESGDARALVLELAYVSNASGRDEGYVRPFVEPGTGGGDLGQWQVSTAGGVFPVWAPDGKQLYYLAAGGDLFALPTVARQTGSPSSFAVCFCDASFVTKRSIFSSE